MMKNVNICATVCVALFTVACFAPAVSLAATYYVSPDGAAAWPGCTAIQTPCSAATAMAKASAGDVVYFREGFYNHAASNDREYPCLNPANSGKAGQPITFIAYPGETPVIASSNFEGGAFGAGHRSYITWDGFSGTLNAFKTGEPQLVGVWYSDHVTIKNCNLTGFLQTTHHNSSLIRVERSSDVTIENNRLHDMNGYVEGEPQYVEESMNSTAITMFYTSSVTIRNNDMYNNWTAIYDKDDGNHNAYYYNHIWGTGSGHQRCAQAVQLKNQRNKVGTGADRKLYQNIIRNCKVGVLLDNGLNFSDVVINNNVFIGMGGSGDGIQHMEAPSATEVQIFNNVFYDFGSYFNFYDTRSFAYVNNNIFHGSAEGWRINWSTEYPTLQAWRAATTFDGTSYLENPRFIKPGGTNAGDYKINAAHKNNGRGGSYPGVIGAYVTGNEHIGCLPKRN